MKRYTHFLFPPFFVMAVFAIVFATNGLFPFGVNSLSWCDMNQQVIPLLCDFKDILNGEEGFFLSMQNAGAMNFYGVFFFFLASPFSFLVAFVSKANIPLLMNILVVLKLCLCAGSAQIYFEKRFSSLSRVFKAVLSVSYAFCGYGMLFYQNIIWLDVMYLFPILMLSIELLAENGSPVLFTVSLAGIIIVNYYLSYMVILFVILFFTLYALIVRKVDIEVFIKLGFGAVCALLLTAVVWLPSLIQYTSSGRISDIIAGLQGCGFFTHTDTSVPVLLCTGIIPCCLILMLSTLHKQSIKTKLFAVVFFMMCVPIFIEPINRMWHTGNYMSFPVRYGFMTVFSGLIICAHYLSASKLAKKGNASVSVIALAVSIGTGTFMLGYTKRNTDTLSRYVQTLWGDNASFKGLILLFLCAGVLYLMVLVLSKKGKIGKKALALCLGILLLSECLCSTTIYVGSANDKLDMKDFTAFAELEGSVEDNGFYRVNMSSKIADANMTGAMGFNSLGHYTSLTDSNYMKAAKQFGLSGYWMEIGNWGGSILSDALLGVKYKISKNGTDYVINQTSGALDLGIKSEAKLPVQLPDGNRLIVLGKYFCDMFALEGNPVTQYQQEYIKGCEYSKIGKYHNLLVSKSDNCIIYNIAVKGEQALYFDCYNGASNALTVPVNNSFDVYVNGECVAFSYPAQNNNGLLELGTYNNENVTVELKLLKDVSCFSFGVFGVDTEQVLAVTQNADDARFTVKRNMITANLNSSHIGEMFLSLPYNDGYKITLNGKKIDYYRCLTGFTQITADSPGELKITFTPPSFMLGASLSVIGIALTIALFTLYKKIYLVPDLIKKVVFILFVSVSTVFLLAVYILPVLINLLY